MSAEIVPLIYNSVAIGLLSEMLCLTDMWRAAGGDSSKRPADWTRKEGSQFIEFISETMPEGHSFISTTEGRNGGTWAHWQIGLAYAKYLSPELHAYVNQVFRNHIERRGETLPIVIERRFAALEDGQKRIEDGQKRIIDLFEEKQKRSRKEIPQSVKDEHDRAVFLLGRRCPLYPEIFLLDEHGNHIVDENGRRISEYDHNWSNQLPTVEHTWLISRQAHVDLTSGKLSREDAAKAFFGYQWQRARLTKEKWVQIEMQV